MDWFSTHRRLTGWLALVALLVQLAASFGHIHAEDIGTFGVSQAQAVAVTGAPDGQPDHDQINCDICATVRLAGTALQPAPPALPTPVVFTNVTLAAATAPATTPAHAASFHARGPPQA